MTVYTTIPSPVGELLLVGERASAGVALTSVSTPGAKNAPVPHGDWRHDPAAFTAAADRFGAYFAGEAISFDLEFAPRGTDFQHRVWRKLDTIPYGTTTTYGALAAELGLPRERIQALGTAIGANPLLIVRPCHRVIGTDGSMRGYAGGVERKHQLLVHEGALQPTLL
ncbi:methylated-DNA--[protein]-cysteine S-methyltransferase [Streptodolium elevatio]|uniref:Methylated-DNA--[protein]-cysteine S-methyltransferase n=1 Tax=Streptodolium elevatio TaxID=3157996 RepID=A0ABV3DAJ7_9ACTN